MSGPPWWKIMRRKAVIDIGSTRPHGGARMTRFPVVLLVLGATASGLSAAPRIAQVRVKEIYTGLPATTALQEQVKKQREDILKDERAANLRLIIGELQDLQAQLSDKARPPGEDAARKLARAYEIKRQEAQTLQKEFESYRAEREKEINRGMVAAMRASLDRIAETSRRLAREQGYDLVLDSSGETNTGVPFVLYQKNRPDLTDAVKAALQDAAPAAAKP
jgi:Skp family chaperone for outer membrane proteins